MKGELFDWLVGYHCKENLERCLPYLKQGRAYDASDSLIQEGEENEHYKGVLIVSNGKTLASKLSQGGVIHDDPEDLEFFTLQNKEDLASYLTLQRQKDGAYIFDGVNNQITRVGELNNNPSSLRERKIYSMAPPDFLSYDGSIPLREMGTKTRLAIKMPLAYQDTSSYLIKRSAFGNTGLGKVAHFGQNGLMQEFFFEHKPDYQGSFINPEHKIVGVYRRWKRGAENDWNLQSEDIVTDLTKYFSRNK